MKTKNYREIQLMVFGGLIAGFLTLTQLNLEEVLRIDRFQHTFVSAAVFILLYFVLRTAPKGMLWAILGALAVGFIKEFGDPSFESLDIVANFCGVTLGLLMVFASQSALSDRHYSRR